MLLVIPEELKKLAAQFNLAEIKVSKEKGDEKNLTALYVDIPEHVDPPKLEMKRAKSWIEIGFLPDNPADVDPPWVKMR